MTVRVPAPPQPCMPVRCAEQYSEMKSTEQNETCENFCFEFGNTATTTLHCALNQYEKKEKILFMRNRIARKKESDRKKGAKSMGGRMPIAFVQMR